MKTTFIEQEMAKMNAASPRRSSVAGSASKYLKLDEVIGRAPIGYLPFRKHSVEVIHCRGSIILDGTELIEKLTIKDCEHLAIHLRDLTSLREVSFERCTYIKIFVQNCIGLDDLGFIWRVPSYGKIVSSNTFAVLSELTIVESTIGKLCLDTVLISSNTAKSSFEIERSSLGELELLSVTGPTVSVKESAVGRVLSKDCLIAETTLSQLSALESLVCTYTDPSSTAFRKPIQWRLSNCRAGRIDFVYPECGSGIAEMNDCEAATINFTYPACRPDSSEKYSLVLSKTQVSKLLVITQRSETKGSRRLTVSECTIHESTVDGVRFSNVTLSHELSSNSRLTFRNGAIEEFHLSDFTNRGTLSFHSIGFGGGDQPLKWTNTDVGVLRMYGCEFPKGLMMDMRHVQLIGLDVAGTDFPTALNTHGKGEDLRQQLGHLAQLKKVHEGSSDTARVHDVHAAYFAMLLKVRKKSGPKKWGDVAILWSNELSNSFGRNMPRSLAWLIGGGIILFTVYCSAQGYTVVCKDIDVGHLRRFFWLSSHFFEFLNPIHRADYLPSVAYLSAGNDKLVGYAGECARLTDGLGRIIMAYFIYQFIQAFRKYGRSA